MRIEVSHYSEMGRAGAPMQQQGVVIFLINAGVPEQASILRALANKTQSCDPLTQKRQCSSGPTFWWCFFLPSKVTRAAVKWDPLKASAATKTPEVGEKNHSRCLWNHRDVVLLQNKILLLSIPSFKKWCWAEQHSGIYHLPMTQTSRKAQSHHGELLCPGFCYGFCLSKTGEKSHEL